MLIFSSTSKPSCCIPGPVASDLMIKAFFFDHAFQLIMWLPSILYKLHICNHSIKSTPATNLCQNDQTTKETLGKAYNAQTKAIVYKSIINMQEREILCRILHDKVQFQDICDEFDLSASTVCTWKKNSDKILTDSVKVGKKRIRMHHSKYKDVELALLYWIKDM